MEQPEAKQALPDDSKQRKTQGDTPSNVEDLKLQLVRLRIYIKSLNCDCFKSKEGQNLLNQNPVEI